MVSMLFSVLYCNCQTNFKSPDISHHAFKGQSGIVEGTELRNVTW
jgi:hypothetical protein